MQIARRRVLQLLSAVPVFGAAVPVQAATTDIVLTCDTTLGPVMRAVANRYYARSGVQVRVFPTGPGLIVAQLERQIQNDVIVTQQAIAVRAANEALVDPAALHGHWHNRLVIAGHGGDTGIARLAVSDPTPASDHDGPAIAAALDLPAPVMLGVIDTDEVAFLLARGTADAGLLHQTDIAANPGFAVIRAVPDAVAPPLAYTAAVTKLSWRPHPQGFVDFLLTPEAAGVLRAGGLEAAT
jgi:molybdate transport system substrate-binding protein